MLRPGSELFTPLDVLSAAFEVRVPSGKFVADAYLELGYLGTRYAFVVEIKSRSAPSVVREGVRMLAEVGGSAGSHPMLMVPYLTERVVDLLRNEGVSGIDLNGNYLIQLQDFVAIRLDQKNRYAESGGIKKACAGDSSIVGRFLLRENRAYSQVTQIHEEIEALGGDISLSTVSKVLSALQDELLIEKAADWIRVLQAGELLNRLVESYQPPRTSDTLKLKLPDDRDSKARVLDDQLGKRNWVWDGTTSAERYTATTPASMWAAYTSADLRALDQLRDYEEARFYNCVVKRAKKSFVYFDSRGSWSAPLECYLALMQGDKREREIAEPLREEILQPFS